MPNNEHLIRYVAVFRDDSAISTLRQFMELPLPPPHPPEFIGSFPVKIPRRMVECAKVREGLSS